MRESAPRDIYHSLLQIAGCFAVVAFHVGIPGFGASSGWIAVELFFALAGYNLFRSRKPDPSFGGFIRQKYLRLAPALLLVAPLALWVAFHNPSSRASLFLGLSPLFLHNVIPLKITDWYGGDAVWIPLWFLAALFQTQLILFWARKRLRESAPWILVAAICVLSLGARLLIYALAPSTDHWSTPQLIYWSPLGHLEVATLGALVVLKKIRLGRWLIPLAVLTIASQLIVHTWGDFMLFQCLWGNTLLAFTMAALIDPENIAAKTVAHWRLKPWLSTELDRVSRLTFYVYALHCSVLFVLWHVMEIPGTPPYFWSNFRTTAVAVLSVAISFLVPTLVAWGMLWAAKARPRG